MGGIGARVVFPVGMRRQFEDALFPGGADSGRQVGTARFHHKQAQRLGYDKGHYFAGALRQTGGDGGQGRLRPCDTAGGLPHILHAEGGRRREQGEARLLRRPQPQGGQGFHNKEFPMIGMNNY